MNLHNVSIEALLFIPVTFGYINQTCAIDNNAIPTMKILWQKEITADANLDCSLGPVTLDETNKRLLIAGTSFRPRVYSEGKFWLMEVDTNNGDIARKTTIKEVIKSKTTLMLASSLISSVTVSENDNIILVGKFDSPTPLLMKTNRSGSASKFIELVGKNTDANQNSNTNDFSIIHSGTLLRDNLLLVGNSKNSGAITKVDSEGTRLWKRNYKIGQGKMDLFTDALSVDGKEEFVIVGCSTNVKGKFPDVTDEDFILRCNAQGDVIAKDIFPGNPWPGEQPQVCQTSSGNFVVIYGKGMQFKHSDINIKAYSSNLELLWEKQVVKSEENKPSSFKIVAKPQNGFIVAVNVDFGNLRVYEYDEKGNQVANLSKDKKVWVGNIGLACMDEKAFVIFQTRPDIEQGKELSRVKIIALTLNSQI